MFYPTSSRPRPFFYVGYRRSFLPTHRVRIVFGPQIYYYYDGYFYRPVSHGYTVVMAPYGAIVPALPWWYGTCVVGGVTYYVVDDTWYRRTSRGYRVVQRPRTVTVERRIVEAPPVVESTEYAESYIDLDSAPDGTWHTVWLDTDDGTRRPIDLLRIDDLWRGPHDEYYERLPTNEQLLSLYAPPSSEEGIEIDEIEHSTRRKVVWIENFNQSRTRIVLHQSLSGRWVGQHGEFYDEFPSEEQLRQLYGLSPD